MTYREIVSVNGLGGLYQLLGSKSDGAIVRNLADNTTKFISARLHHVTPLESIEIYTTGENVRLHEVLQVMKDSKEQRPSPNDAKAIKAYFQSVYPNLDGDRVYVSDMKKMLKWFEILQGADLLDFSIYQQENLDTESATAASETPITEAPAEEAPTAEEKPVKKARAKKAAEPAGEEGEAPAKKTARKKSAATADTEGSEEKPAKKTAAKKKKEEE